MIMDGAADVEGDEDGRNDTEGYDDDVGAVDGRVDEGNADDDGIAEGTGSKGRENRVESLNPKSPPSAIKSSLDDVTV